MCDGYYCAGDDRPWWTTNRPAPEVQGGGQ